MTGFEGLTDIDAMPTSHFQQLNEIMRLVAICKPKSILDVGVGFGKYGMLCREYLELWTDHDQPLTCFIRFAEHFTYRIDGIEVCRRYLTPMHDYIYDQIFQGNALDVLPTLTRHYELILLIDILEHFSFDDGLRVLSICNGIADNVLISTPREFKPQNPEFGNEFEIHRSHWELGDFDSFRPVFEMPQKESLIVFFGKDVKKMERCLK